MLECGILRIAPASSFVDQEHNTARRDDELTLTTHITPYDYDMGLVDNYFLRLMPTRRFATIHHKKPCDHYLYCVTVVFDPRLLFDFNDTCIIIRDQNEFRRRLMRFLKWRLPGWTLYFDQARYVDPYFVVQRIPSAGDEIFFSNISDICISTNIVLLLFHQTRQQIA